MHFTAQARVVTVFSSSHYCGGFNSAAVILVARNKLQVIVTEIDSDLVDGAGSVVARNPRVESQQAALNDNQSEKTSENQSAELQDKGDAQKLGAEPEARVSHVKLDNEGEDDDEDDEDDEDEDEDEDEADAEELSRSVAEALDEDEESTIELGPSLLPPRAPRVQRIGSYTSARDDSIERAFHTRELAFRAARQAALSQSQGNLPPTSLSDATLSASSNASPQAANTHSSDEELTRESTSRFLSAWSVRMPRSMRSFSNVDEDAAEAQSALMAAADAADDGHEFASAQPVSNPFVCLFV